MVLATDSCVWWCPDINTNTVAGTSYISIYFWFSSAISMPAIYRTTCLLKQHRSAICYSMTATDHIVGVVMSICSVSVPVQHLPARAMYYWYCRFRSNLQPTICLCVSRGRQMAEKNAQTNIMIYLPVEPAEPA